LFGRFVMSLIRTGFILACGVALLPADKAQQEHVINQAAQAAGWAATYCAREPVKCEQAAALWDSFKDKAIIAGRLALEASQKYAASPALQGAPQNIVTAAADLSLKPMTVSRDTLTRQDKTPAWRGTKTK
jgi:hypothetical protein